MAQVFDSGYRRKLAHVERRLISEANKSVGQLASMFESGDDLLELTRQHGRVLGENLALKKRIFELKRANQLIKRNLKRLKMILE